jgi:AraC family transcriptional regulator of adaptative response / DNA-3-methyladenine glycosylase II
MTTIAFAAGFSSIRQFNGTVRDVYASSPTELRARAAAAGGGGGSTVHLRLAFRGPLHAPGLFGHLVATGVPGLEEWRDGAYHRALRLEHGPGVVSLRPAADHVAATVRLTDHRDLVSAVARCRWLLDLDADPVAVDAALAADPALRAAVEAAPGRRVPRCVDGSELALRIVLGQQVSTAAARTVTGRLVAALGDPLPAALVEDGSSLGWTFPAPAAVAEADPGLLGMPRTRAATLRALAGALDRGELDLSPGADRVGALEALGRLPGVGPWTVASVAMRALGHPDAFPATDLGIAEAGRRLGLASPRELVAHSERWRPWRSYATQVLWGTLDHPINTLPPTHDEPTQRSTRDELDHLRRVAGRTAATDRARRRRPHPSPVRR